MNTARRCGQATDNTKGQRPQRWSANKLYIYAQLFSKTESKNLATQTLSAQICVRAQFYLKNTQVCLEIITFITVESVGETPHTHAYTHARTHPRSKTGPGSFKLSSDSISLWFAWSCCCRARYQFGHRPLSTGMAAAKRAGFSLPLITLADLEACSAHQIILMC